MIALCKLFHLAAVLTVLSLSDGFPFNSRYLQKSGHSLDFIHQKGSSDKVLRASSDGIESVSVTSPESDGLKQLQPPSEPHQFDISLAVILAGYSFEAYNEQVNLSSYAFVERRSMCPKIVLMWDVIGHSVAVIIRRLSYFYCCKPGRRSNIQD